MATTSFTVIDDGIRHEVEALVVGDSIRIPPEAIGFARKPEGLCRGPLCYPIPEGSTVVEDAGLELRAFAALSQRPIAVDLDHNAVYLGVSPADRGAAIESLRAPDFTLPDLDGKLHSLSEQRGKKVLLVAYASW